jgi:hypothetical protein
MYTMEKIDFQAHFDISGVRGRNVYQLTPRRQLVTGPGNSLDVVIQQRFVNSSSPYRVRAHNAELHPTVGGNYELLIPASGSTPVMRVRVHFDTKPTLVGGIHGTEQGPAQYQLTRDSSGWQAKIEVNETLHRRDVPFIVGHELDEIAVIVRTNPPDKAALVAQARASLFKPGSTSTFFTAHDRAAAHELCALWEDYQHPPQRTDATERKKRGDRLLRMFDAMGLSESVHIFDKLRLLRASGAPDTLLRRIGIPRAYNDYRKSVKFRQLQAKFPSLRSSGTIVDEALISHLMIPLDPGRRLFSQDGIKGGHDETLLHEFVNSHPQIVIVKEAEKVAKGVVYRKYSQYRWDGSGSKPSSHDKRFPKPSDAMAGKYDSRWILAKRKGVPLPKTTFSNRDNFLLAVDEAWLLWYKANAVLAPLGITTEFTYFSSEAGIQVTGFFYYISGTDYGLDTAYVEASWF